MAAEQAVPSEGGACGGDALAAYDAAVPPDRLTPDSIMREICRLGAVIQRVVRPREGGSRSMQVLVRLANHESAMADGIMQRELSQAELAEVVGIRPQSIGPILVRLEQEGLITRSSSNVDRRTHLIGLTEAGRAAAEEARAFQCAFAEKTLAVLSEDERTALASAVVKINDALDELS